MNTIFDIATLLRHTIGQRVNDNLGRVESLLHTNSQNVYFYSEVVAPTTKILSKQKPLFTELPLQSVIILYLPYLQLCLNLLRFFFYLFLTSTLFSSECVQNTPAFLLISRTPKASQFQ